MFRVKRFFAVCLSVCLIGQAQAQDFQGIAAVVNDDVISMFDLYERMQLLLKSLRIEDSLETRDQIRPQTLQSLIDERLQVQEATQLGLSIGELEIQSALSEIAQRNGFQGNNPDDFFLSQGVEPKTIKDQIRARLLWSKIVQRQISPEVEIDPEEVSEVIERMKRNSGKPEYLAAEIFLSIDRFSSETTVAATMDSLIRRIAATKNFAAVATEFSQSASAERGGDLGWVQEGDIEEALWQKLSKMQSGEVVGPIRTLAGYHVLLLRETRISGEELSVKLGLKQILFPKNADISLDQQMAEAATLRQNLSGCDSADEDIKNQDNITLHNLGTLALNDLPEMIRQAVGPLEAGASSEPIDTEAGVMILLVCERRDPQNDGSIRDAIEQRLQMQRIDLASRRYLRELRRTAHIDIRTGE